MDGKGRMAAGCASPPDPAILISCVGRKMVLKQRIEEEVEGVRMEKMHSLLKRQLKRFFNTPDEVPPELSGFIEAVNGAYQEFDVDRKMLEHSLEISSQEMLHTDAELRAILLALPDVFFIIDANGKILDYEAGSSNDFLFPAKEEIIGKKIQDVNFHDVGHKFVDAIGKVNKTNARIDIEYDLQIKDDTNCYEARLVPFINDQIIVIIRNITARKKSDEAIRRAEKRFRSLIEKASDLIAIIDIKGAIRYASPSCESVLDYKMDELLGKKVRDFIHPDDLRIMNPFISEGILSAEPFYLELRLRHKNGSWRTFETISRDLFDQPEIGGMIVNARDITERKQAEEAQKMSEKLYRAIFENTGTAMLIIEKDNRISLANKTAFEISGYSVDEGKKFKNWSELITKESIQNIAEHLQNMGNDVRGKRYYEVQLITRTGEIKDIFLLVDNIEGTDQRIASIMDVTDIRMAQRALQESEAKYRLLVENASEGIFIIQDNIIKFPNHSTIATTGYSEDELAQLPFTALVHPDDLDHATATLIKQLKGKKPAGQTSFRMITKTGEVLWAELQAVETLWQGKPALINFVRNITEQKKLESLLIQAQKLEAIGTLAGGIAHDFNNLLMGIQGYASIMLMDDERPHREIEMLRSIEQQVKSGADLTKQLLGFARGGKYEMAPTNINELIQKTAAIFSRTKKEITVYGKYEENIWIVDIDRGQIEQSLLNLYVNAWQAMPGGGEIYLETKNATVDETTAAQLDMAPGKYVKISVTDTGVGMDQKTQSRIFEPFFTTKEMGRGTGLGLASVYGIIKNHKGYINVYSEKGHGSKFSIYLPSSNNNAKGELSSSANLFRGNETILLIDDENIVAEVTQKLLEKLGYKVLFAQSGKKALEIYKEQKDEIRLVILDMIMPEMSGEETFTALKVIDPHVKVILSSGYSVNQAVSDIMDLGCRDFVQKPFDINDLSKKLRTVIDSPS
ncbi:MAG: PAS domain S-box protein [Deltaproteobacteria bacterium]|nr:PAS domain S-box protein [Deltaproteobacteria bacterium]